MREYNVLLDDIDAYLCHKVLGWRIGLAKFQQGLYYLPWTDFSKWQGDVYKVAILRTTSEEKIMEAHMRMGHPSFFLLKHMYSHLFKDIVFEKQMCEAC